MYSYIGQSDLKRDNRQGGNYTKGTPLLFITISAIKTIWQSKLLAGTIIKFCDDLF